MEEKADFTNLTGLEKTAALMLSLSETQIAKVFSLMDEDEIREISLAMSSLGKLSSEVVGDLIQDFTEQMSATGALVGSLESTERLLSKSLSTDQVSAIMEEIRGPAGRTMWEKLGNVSEDVLASFLKNEYPQTVAVVLSKIRTEHASKVITLLPEQMSMEVILRMLRMEPVQKDIIEDIERTLRSEFMSNLSRANSRDPYELVADMFNFLDRTTEEKFISGLTERSAEDAERVQSLMFTFDDLLKIDDTGIQAIIRIADKTKLSLAMKGANENMKELFFKNMSERGGKLMKEEMESMGMVKVKDVEEAQAAIVVGAKTLADKGEISIDSGSDDGDQLIG